MQEKIKIEENILITMLKRCILFILALYAGAVCLFGQSALKTENDVTNLNVDGKPFLMKTENGVTNLYVDGKPFLVLSGELHNSTSTSEAYMSSIGVWVQMKNAHFNTVIASCSWDVVEPEEGKYDFSSVDHVIINARKNGLKVVMIWFASWKNGESSYAPGYIKRNPKKYALAMDEKGNYHNVLSTFGKDAMNADARAFAALMRHIKSIDTDNTVIMMQVENEMGVLGPVRDFSPAAQKAWKGQVPSDLMSYLKAHRGQLFPELEKVWAANGYKVSGTWEEVFGKSHQQGWPEYPYYTEEIFQAYHYAKYTEFVTDAGKAEHNIPMYVNNWLRQPTMVIPGTYPSGSPLPEVLDIWRAAAPSVDFSAPDIYIDEYDWVLSEFTRSGNPLFIPECRGDASKALYAYGEYDAFGFAPFGFDGPQEGNYFGVLPEHFKELASVYGILSEMSYLILANRGAGSDGGSRLGRGAGSDGGSDLNRETGNAGGSGLSRGAGSNGSSGFGRGAGSDGGSGRKQVSAPINGTGSKQVSSSVSGSDTMRGLFISKDSPNPSVVMGDYVISAKATKENVHSGALIVQTSADEFYIVAINAAFSFGLKTQSGGLYAAGGSAGSAGSVGSAGLAGFVGSSNSSEVAPSGNRSSKLTNVSAMTEVIEEGEFRDGVWIPGRRLNGDENRVIINGVAVQRIVLYPSPVPASSLPY